MISQPHSQADKDGDSGQLMSSYLRKEERRVRKRERELMSFMVTCSFYYALGGGRTAIVVLGCQRVGGRGSFGAPHESPPQK